MATLQPAKLLSGALSAITLLNIGSWVLGCSGDSRSAELNSPTPTLAGTTTAQAEFRELSATWHTSTPKQRLKLEQPLRSFLTRHPQDDQARMVRVLLAWILIQKGNLVEAERLVEATRRGPPGVARDFATVADAALMVRHHRPQDAIKELRRLQGKIIDPVERFLATEQLVLATLAAELYAESLLYMLDWAEQAAPHERDAVHNTISSQLRPMPRQVLERALTTLAPSRDRVAQQANPVRYEQEVWLYERITQRLAQLAIQQQDVDLARQVIQKQPKLSETEEDELVRLSTGGTPLASIHGRTIGLLLSTASDLHRRRSSEVATGVAVALRFTEKVSENTAIELISVEETGEPGAAAQAMLQLASQGAALLIAGVDEPSADAATLQAERMRIPLLALHAHSFAKPRFTFTTGVSQRRELRLLKEQVAIQGRKNSIRIDAEASYCRGELYSSGRPTFPFAQWERDNVDAIVLLDLHPCARALLDGARKSRFHPTYALGLNAAARLGLLSGESWVSLTAGGFPFRKDDPAIASWTRRVGRAPSWHETLGHDAARLAAQALRMLPTANVNGQKEVKRFHVQLRQALLEVDQTPVQLWSTQKPRFDRNLSLERELKFISQTR